MDIAEAIKSKCAELQEKFNFGENSDNDTPRTYNGSPGQNNVVFQRDSPQGGFRSKLGVDLNELFQGKTEPEEPSIFDPSPMWKKRDMTPYAVDQAVEHRVNNALGTIFKLSMSPEPSIARLAAEAERQDQGYGLFSKVPDPKPDEKLALTAKELLSVLARSLPPGPAPQRPSNPKHTSSQSASSSPWLAKKSSSRLLDFGKGPARTSSGPPKAPRAFLEDAAVRGDADSSNLVNTSIKVDVRGLEPPSVATAVVLLPLMTVATAALTRPNTSCKDYLRSVLRDADGAQMMWFVLDATPHVREAVVERLRMATGLKLRPEAEPKKIPFLPRSMSSLRRKEKTAATSATASLDFQDLYGILGSPFTARLARLHDYVLTLFLES